MAHTANDSLDVIDGVHGKYLHSIPNLPGVAGALVSNEKDLVFTSNRGEKTVGIFHHEDQKGLAKGTVGGHPNGLAYDPARDRLLAANVSKPDDPTPITVSVMDVRTKSLIADIVVPGRTRWTVFDKKTDRFYVNISNPSKIVAVNSKDPDGIVASYDIPATGPHGLDLDVEGRRLFCACDDKTLCTIDLTSGKVSRAASLSGQPDVIFYNRNNQHLYVAVSDPAVIDLVDTRASKLIQTVKTEAGAHTISFNSETSQVCAFLPESHRVSIYNDR